jgi:hypothetical protein
MGMPFIMELMTKVKHECAVCHETKILKYLIDNEGEMLNVCEECIDALLIKE